ncbi:MAG TPA: exonuclease [Desulfonatronum sp.]|nr:exonuclease [Desulfonatronum sp.]
MLTHSFCHVPGIGRIREQKMWNAGIHRWDNALRSNAFCPCRLSHAARAVLTESPDRLSKGDTSWFVQKLPQEETWRLCSHFAYRAAFVDIETTSGPGPVNITTIALFDGKTVRTYVQGRNLEAFCDDILDYPLMITFNGRCFDAPIIERELKISLPAHVDLRFLLKSVGVKGGLKACERRLGMDREELDGLDGYFAVLLWQEYEARGDEQALETLLAYNAADVLSMPILLEHAYAAKLEQTPFTHLPRLRAAKADNPHQAHSSVIKRIRKRFGIRFLPKMAAE